MPLSAEVGRQGKIGRQVPCRCFNLSSTHRTSAVPGYLHGWREAMCGGGSSCPTTLPFYYLTFFSLFHSCLSSLSHLSSFNFHVADLSFCSRMDVFTLPYLCMQVVVQYLSQYADMSRMNKVPYGNPYATLSRHASKTLRSIHTTSVNYLTCTVRVHVRTLSISKQLPMQFRLSQHISMSLSQQPSPL